MSASLRLFTAVELPQAVRDAAHAAARPVVASHPGARPTAPGNLHVTVRFLGDTPPDTVERLHGALTQAASRCPAGEVRLRGFGAFPGVRQPRILWVGIDDVTGAIARLEQAVTAGLVPLGFPPEDRPFHAHVTVARIGGDPRSRPRRKSGREGARLELPPPEPIGPPFDVSELVLYASELSREGPRYRALARFLLARAGAP